MGVRITKLVGSFCAICVAALGSVSVHAQQYPSKTVRIIVGFAAGGSTDAIARFCAQRLSEVLKAPVIVDNKPGAGQMVAINAVKSAPPDGYTLYLGSGSALSQAPGVRKDLGYDPLKDFSLIALVATVPGVIVVSPDLPVRSVRDLVTYAQAHPAQLNYASSGIGSASHLQTEYLNSVTGMKITHIPFKADSDIMRELSVGRVHMGISPLQGAMPFISSGKVRAVAVTGARRMKGLPEVPSISEAGFKGLEGIDPYTYYGLVGPAGVPEHVVAKVNEAVNTVSKMPKVVEQLQAQQFARPVVDSPDSFRRYIQDDIGKWSAFGKVIKTTE